MKEPIIYLLEVLASGGILLAAYRLLFEQHASFAACRRYLLGSPLLAAGIPLLRIPVWSARPTAMPTVVMGDLTAEIAGPSPAAPTIAPEAIALALYAAGTAVMLGLLFRQYLAVRRLEHGVEAETRDGIRYVRTRRRIAACSFFRTIYLPEGLSDAELPAIVAHERSHIRHRHSAERLAMELFKALLWWNPFVWIAARKLVETQEFEADSDVIAQGHALPQYMETLFNQLFGYTPEIANGLQSSLTKKRFDMMTRQRTNRHARLRTAAALSIAASLVVAFGFTTRAAVRDTDRLPAEAGQQRTITIHGQVVLAPDDTPAAGARIIAGESMTQIAARAETIPHDTRSDAQGYFSLQGPAEGYLVVSNSEGTIATAHTYRCEVTEGELSIVVRLEAPPTQQVPDDAPYLSVETMPRFEGGDLTQFRTWAQAQIRYPEEAMHKGVQGRVIAQFVIEPDGTLDEISILQTPDASLSDEARRILESSPRWTPGLQKGEPVRVKFAFPIDFRLESSEPSR